MVDVATDEIAAAVREAGEARALAEAVAERVRNGGEAKADELRNARDLAELAELRVEAAQRRADDAERAERARLLAELAADVAAHDTAGDALADDLAAMAAALDRFVINTAARNSALADLRSRAVALDVPPETVAGPRALALTDDGVSHDGRRMSRFDPGPLIAATVYRAAYAHTLRVGGAHMGNLLPDLIGPYGPHEDLGEFVRRYA